ncbi:MAG: thioredoxin domain-containing protein [Nanoarchaeota archaeon]
MAKNKSDNTWLYAIAVAQLLLLVVVVFQVGSLSGKIGTAPADDAVVKDDGTDVQAPPPTAPVAPKVDMTKLLDDDAVRGDAKAPITIVEFSDYECPFCARFYTQTLGQIETNYIDTGKAKLIFRDFPLSFHPQAQKAAEAAECAGEQGKYYDMHDLLFGSGVAGGVDGFKQYAADIGLDTTAFDTCLDSGKMAAETAKDMQDGAAAGISGTPGFIINGRQISGACPFATFQAALDAELAGKDWSVDRCVPTIA